MEQAMALSDRGREPEISATAIAFYSQQDEEVGVRP